MLLLVISICVFKIKEKKVWVLLLYQSIIVSSHTINKSRLDTDKFFGTACPPTSMLHNVHLPGLLDCTHVAH